MADSFEQVVEKEWRDYVQPRRPQQERSGAEDADPNQRNLTGLAISGGGIRSASFAVGVLQVLADRGILSKFDYLSTVSGGGFLGTWLSATMGSAEKRGDEWASPLRPRRLHHVPA